MRRTFLKSAVVLGLLCATPALARAQGWQPTRPIKMICPFPAGGGTDQIARIVAQQLTTRSAAGLCREPRWRQRRSRRPGGDAGRARRLHHRRDLRFADDGQSMDVREACLQAAAGLHCGGADQPFSFPAGRSPLHRIKTVADLIRLAKEKPGTLNYLPAVSAISATSASPCSPSRPASTSCTALSRVGPGTQAIVAGDVQLMYNNIATALPQVEAGKLTGIAVGGEQRFPALANVPTIAETVPAST